MPVNDYRKRFFNFIVMLARRLANISSRYFFCFLYAPSFHKIGSKTFMFSPFRIDGASAIEVGASTVFQKGGWMYAISKGKDPVMQIGSRCVFGYSNHITAVGKLTIGDDVLTANNVYISDNHHSYEDISRPIIDQPVVFKRAVSIGDGCWIGENACIIGASIGRNSTIGANAVVTKDIPEYSVAVGVPAKVVRQFDRTRQCWVSL